MRDDPEFFLTSSEIRPTIKPRKCWILENLWSDERGIFFLRIMIKPPLVGRLVNINQEVINEVVIAPRHTSVTLVPIRKLPITVYVCQINNDQIKNTGRISAKDLDVILIGEIYKTLKDAENAIENEKTRI